MALFGRKQITFTNCCAELKLRCEERYADCARSIEELICNTLSEQSSRSIEDVLGQDIQGGLIVEGLNDGEPIGCTARRFDLHLAAAILAANFLAVNRHLEFGSGVKQEAIRRVAIFSTVVAWLELALGTSHKVVGYKGVDLSDARGVAMAGKVISKGGKDNNSVHSLLSELLEQHLIQAEANLNGGASTIAHAVVGAFMIQLIPDDFMSTFQPSNAVKGVSVREFSPILSLGLLTFFLEDEPYWFERSKKVRIVN